MKQIIEYFKTIGVDANTTATIFITLFTFFLGYVVTWIASQIKERRTKRSYRKVFLTVLGDFSQSCKKQHKAIIDSLEQSTDIEGQGKLVFNISPINTLDYLVKLDYHLYLSNFQPLFYQKKFSKASSTLFTLITVIREQNREIEEFITVNVAELKVILSDYASGFAELRNTFDEVCYTVIVNPSEYLKFQSWYDDYIEIFRVFTEDGGPYDSSFAHKRVVQKIIDLNSSNLKLPIALQSLKFARQCDVAYGKLKSKEIYIKDRFSRFAFAHRWAYKVTSVIIKILK